MSKVEKGTRDSRPPILTAAGWFSGCHSCHSAVSKGRGGGLRRKTGWD